MNAIARAACAASAAALFVTSPSSLAQPTPTWRVMEMPDHSSCAAVGEGNVLFATPDGTHYGIFVPGVTVGAQATRPIKIDGADVPFRWVQVRTSAFSLLDAENAAKFVRAKSLEIDWPDHHGPLSAGASLAVAYSALKGCGEALDASREAAKAAAATPTPPPADGPLNLTLECQGSAKWAAMSTVSGDRIGDVTHDRDVAYESGGQGTVRVHLGPDGNTVKFPATFPPHVSRRPLNLASVETGPDRIVGRAHTILGTLTALTIDRRSGEIDLNYANVRFSGNCRKVDEATEPRKF